MVDLTGARIKIDGYDVGLRIPLPEFLDDTFSHDMVGKAGKRLTAHDVAGAVFDQLYHFPGQEPSFTGLVTDAHDGFRIFHNLIDTDGSIEVLTVL